MITAVPLPEVDLISNLQKHINFMIELFLEPIPG